MDNLKYFLFDLGADAELEKRYRSNPDVAIEDYALSAEAADALKRGNVEALRTLTGLEDLHLTTSPVKAYR